MELLKYKGDKNYWRIRIQNKMQMEKSNQEEAVPEQSEKIRQLVERRRVFWQSDSGAAVV